MSQTNSNDPNSVVTMTKSGLDELQKMANLVTSLQHRIDALTFSNNKNPEPRVSDPEHFSGNRNQLRSFVSQVKLVIQAQKSRFQTENQKVIYAATFLRGAAFSWFQPYTEKSENEPLLNNFDLFVNELYSMFGDPNQIASAERQLKKLKQKGPAANYASDFRRIAALVEWNDAALRNQFYEGLKDDVKDFLVNYDTPSSLNDYITLAIKVDNRLFDRRREKQRSNHFQRQPSMFNFSRDNHSHNPNAMEIDATMTKNLASDFKEKQRRYDNNLRFYCAKSGHKVATCPNRPQGYDANYNKIDDPQKYLLKQGNANAQH